MKKIYLLSLLCCMSMASFAQLNATIWSAAVAGSYITGNSTATVRTDNNIVSTSTTQCGYAVFDLTTIPAGSQINSVVLGYYVFTYGGSGTGTGFNTFGYAGDLSLLTTAGALFPAMTSGTSLSTATYGAGTGNFTIASTAAFVSFLQSRIGSKVSICWTGGGTRIYNIKGENGSTATTTTANHAPYITINYCPPPTAVTATALPTPLCEGDLLNLTGTGAAAAGGTLSWSWSGPGGFTSSSISPSLTTGPSSSGVYTLTVTNTCTAGAGTGTALTGSVVVNPLPTAFTAGLNVCEGSTNTLSSTPTGGSWVSSNTAIATVGAASGDLTGVSAGSCTISYTDLLGCLRTGTANVNSLPGAISGPTQLCDGSSNTLTNPVAGGSWSVDFPSIATIGASSGTLTGLTPGVVTVSYTNAGCTPATYTVTVVALPSAISGTANTCVGAISTLADPDPGLIWSSSDISLATVGATGDVHGVAAGTVTISYTDPATTCAATVPFVVYPIPAAIGGPSGVCVGSSITLTDATPGGTWTGGGAFANVIAGSGVVNGVAAGVAYVTYTVSVSGCSVVTPITVNALPAAISSGTGIVCQGATIPYTEADPGGIWSSVNTGVATVGALTGIVTGIAAGITSIQYTSAAGCIATAAISVNAAPVALITASGPTTFCAGGSVVLNGSTGGGYTYQWNRGGTPITGATNSTHSANITGAYTISITNGLGCVTTSASTNVVAGIVGTIQNTTPLTFCLGQSVLLTASTGAVSGSMTYQWKKDGISIPSATAISYNATTSGMYSCQINVSGGSGTCIVISDTNVVLANALPTPTITKTGAALKTGTGYGSYQWYLNTVAIPGAISNTFTPTVNGSYKVRVSDGNACSNFSPAFQLTGVGVNEIVNAQDVKISPNPATSFLHIECAVQVRVIITGIEGKVYVDINDSKDINVANLANGMYLISLYDMNGTRILVDKLIKE